ncbi:hypothetical protein [Agromyces sp. CCNWLW203]|uniref:hypothetical protein n=1 Tax=Agromyces sp. CCNWLW203 TaxID=3112842 RepID=UPI002F96315F
MTNDAGGLPADPRDPVQDEPIMADNDASTRAKWEGIITQTRADLGHHNADEIRRALAQRVSDAQLAVPAGELDRVARELAATIDDRDRFDRTIEHGGE